MTYIMIVMVLFAAPGGQPPKAVSMPPLHFTSLENCETMRELAQPPAHVLGEAMGYISACLELNTDTEGRITL